MSMILEALRRADRERQGPASTPPNLSSVHYPPVEPTSRRRTRLIPGLLLLLIGAAMGVAVTYWQWNTSVDRPPGTPEQSASLERVSLEPPATDATPVPNQTPEPEPVQSERPTEVARLYHSEPERSTQTSEIHRLYNPPKPEPEPAPAVRNEAQAPPEPEAALQPASEPEPRSEPEHESPPAPLTLPTAESALSIRALSSAMQQAIPSIYYQGHHYQEGQSNYVVLNQREYRPGDEVVTGVILEQISEDGIVLSFRGEQFRLARLSSWVNL